MMMLFLRLRFPFNCPPLVSDEARTRAAGRTEPHIESRATVVPLRCNGQPAALNFADDVVRVGPLNMKLNSQDLKKIAELTLDCYNQNAEDFWEGTRNHDVSQNIAALLQHIESERPFTILDFGCGPGRDLKVFAELGHIAMSQRPLVVCSA